MKVLIITATIGQGHNAVARSVESALRERGVDCEVLDMYRYFSPALQKIVQGGYLISIRSVKHARVIGEKYYDAMEKNYRPLNEHSLARVKSIPLALNLRRYLEQYRPDLIVCTQVYCVHVVDTIKARGWIDTPVIGIDTDFTVQAHWEGNEHLDYIVTASGRLTEQLLRKKIPEERILPFGIPIGPRFRERTPKEEARELLCLDPKKKTLLIMGGSMGYGRIDKTLLELDALPLDFQTMVVCGSNLRMRDKLRKLETRKRFDVYGFSYDIPLMMDAADVMVTKPGGISLSEGLAKGLPMVLANAIPGMEDRNSVFMTRNGLAVEAGRQYSVSRAVADLFGDDALRARMSAAMADFAHPDSTEVLCDFICDREAPWKKAAKE